MSASTLLPSAVFQLVCQSLPIPETHTAIISALKARGGILRRAMRQYAIDKSRPTKLRPIPKAAMPVVPLPMNGSRTSAGTGDIATHDPNKEAQSHEGCQPVVFRS